MSQLTRSEKDGYQIYVANDGRAFYTQTTLVKLMGIDNKALTKILESKGVGNYSHEFPEVLTEGGLQGVGNLIDSSDLKTIIKAYNPTSQKQKDRKEQLLDALIDAGSLAFAYKLAGYELKPAAVSQPLDLTEAIFGALSNQVKRVSYNETQANNTIATIKPYQEKLNAKEETTKQIGMIMGKHRLTLEDDRSMQSTHCQRTVHKQLRQTQIALEGIESVHDDLLAGDERKDKAKALKNNPSSKQDLLPDVPGLIVAVN